MLRSPGYSPAKAAAPHSGGFTLIEVMVAVSIAAGVISLLVPTLLRQVAIGEESNRLTVVEAVVSSDLDRFRYYAKIWKLQAGSYVAKKSLTMTPNEPRLEAAAIYDPPSDECNEPPDSTNGLAASLLRDGQSQNDKIFIPTTQFSTGSWVNIPFDTGGVRGFDVERKVDAVGSKMLISYRLPADNPYRLNFSRSALVLVEAAAWCDRLP